MSSQEPSELPEIHEGGYGAPMVEDEIPPEGAAAPPEGSGEEAEGGST